MCLCSKAERIYEVLLDSTLEKRVESERFEERHRRRGGISLSFGLETLLRETGSHLLVLCDL